MSSGDPSPFAYNASQTLVLFLDFHSLFVDFIKAHDAAEKAAALKAWAHQHKIAVAHGLINDDPKDKPPTNIKGLDTTKWIWESLCAKKENFKEPAGITPADGEDEEVFTRTPGYISALTSHSPRDIKKWLAEKGYRSLILCGLSTSGCVMRTATAATDAGFIVTVIEDACMDKPEVHKVVVNDILPTRAHVFSFEDFTKQWKD